MNIIHILFKFKISTLFFFLFFLALNNGLQVSDTVIATSRNPIRTAICSYFIEDYTDIQKQNSKQTVKQYTYLSNSQIEDMLFNQNYSQTNIYTILIVLPHVLGLVILFLAIPGLFCCCMWPQKYPICKKFRKPEQQMYKRCQLKWPAYTTLILYSIVAIVSITALFIAADFIQHFNNMGCRFVAIFDDTQYGRISSKFNNRFFVGLDPLSTQLNTFNTAKISTFFSDSSSALTNAPNIRNKQSIIQNDLQSQYTSYNNIAYTNAFSADGSSYYSVTSDFKSMYWGPTSNSSTILGDIKTKLTVIFDQVNLGLDAMITAWNGLSTTTQAGVSNQITTTISSIGTLNTVLNGYMLNISQVFNQPQNFSQILMLFQFIYGVIFALSLLGLIGAVLIACFTVVRSRLIIYFTCGGLTIFNLITFSMLITFSYIHPNLSQTCAYMDVQLTSGATTKTMFTNMGYGTFGNLLDQCMSDGNGKLIDKIDSSFSTSFDQINTIAIGTQLFNSIIPDYTVSNLAAPITSATTIVNKIETAQLWEISDSTAKTHVGKVVSKTYPINVNCNSTAVNGDAWMPSFSLFNCPGGKFKKAQCSPLSSFSNCALGCYQIYNQFVSPSGDHSYISNLATRYSSSSCNYFQYVTNLHDNWNVPRATQMSSVQTIIDNFQTQINDYAAQTNPVQASLSSFSTTLQSNMNSQTNLTSGTFNGVDCRVIGQSIEDFRDSMCIGLLQSITNNLICLGIISYAILLIAIFGTYNGVQHFKHLQKMQMNVGYKGVPISISDTRILDK